MNWIANGPHHSVVTTPKIPPDLNKVTELLQDFSSLVSPTMPRAFANISPQGMVNALRARVRSPWLINQGKASLCGPAAFFYALVKDAPQVYVKCVLDLYLHGHARIHQLEIRPSIGCKSVTLCSKSGINSVDWIALASLRDSANRLFDYNSPARKLAGITLPSQLSTWFRLAGYKDVLDQTNLVFSRCTQSLQSAERDFSQGKHVCLFVTVKSAAKKFGLKAIPNHWVALSQRISVQGDQPLFCSMPKDQAIEQSLGIQVFTWGSGAYELNPQGKSAKEFCKYYFGYVSAS